MWSEWKEGAEGRRDLGEGKVLRIRGGVSRMTERALC